MTDLRKAAEQAIEAIMHGGVKEQAAAVYELRQALAQPEQYRCHWVEKGKGHCERNKRMGFDDDYGNPKREWVGLTDEERSNLLTEHHGWNEYGKAIEAKLKEKNKC